MVKGLRIPVTTGSENVYVTGLPSLTSFEFVVRAKFETVATGGNATVFGSESRVAASFDSAGKIRLAIWTPSLNVLLGDTLTSRDNVDTWWKWTYDETTGAYTFSYADGQEEEPSTWTSGGSGSITPGPMNAITVLFLSTYKSNTSDGMPGNYYKAILRDSPDGTLVGEWSAPHSGIRHRDSTGKIWTVNGSAYSTVID